MLPPFASSRSPGSVAPRWQRNLEDALTGPDIVGVATEFMERYSRQDIRALPPNSSQSKDRIDPEQAVSFSQIVNFFSLASTRLAAIAGEEPADGEWTLKGPQ